LHNYKALGKFLDRIDDGGGFEVTRFPSVIVKDLEGIVDDSLEVDWKVMGVTGI
jgi:hypothetical protein